MIVIDERVQIAGPMAPPGWNEFVDDCPAATIYHEAPWRKVIAQSYGFDPIFITLSDASGAILWGLPLFMIRSPLTGRRLVSLPYTNAAGPLCRPGVNPEPLLTAAIELARQENCRYVEVRGQPGQELREYPGFQRSDYFGTFLLSLEPGPGRVRERFDKRARRGIAKAVRSGINVRFGTDLSALRAFYQLNLLTRRKHGVPPQPFRFFETLWNTLRPRGEIEVLLAEVEQRTVASLVLLAKRDTVTYAYGASDQNYLRSAPNHALFDEAICWSGERGYRIFDFGRTSPDNVGLREFKRQWGAEWFTLPYDYWPGRNGFVSESETGLAYRCFTSLWRRLPIIVTRTLGPALYRNMA